MRRKIEKFPVYDNRRYFSMITHLRNDYVFKLAFLYNSPHFSPIHLTLQYLIYRVPSSFIITNSELLKTNPYDKGIRYDIKIKDNENRNYEIEMQDSQLSITQIKRFTYYGAKLIDSNITMGEDYDHIQQNIQIIFVNDINQLQPTLIECYESLEKCGIKEGESVSLNHNETVLLRYYIYLPYIKEIEKEKGIENLNDFETMISIIYHGIHPKMKKGKVVKHMEKVFNTVNSDSILSIRAYERAVYLATEQQEKDEYFERGKKYILMHLYQLKYPSCDVSWIQTCSKSQIEILSLLMHQDITYEEFIEKVNRKEVAQ